MFTLTGFGDEISPVLKEQMDLLEGSGIRHLELRGVNKKNVMELTDQEIAEVKDALDKRGFKISCIGSPIGKIKITDDFAEHLEKFKRAIYLAHFFDTPYIRIFSYYISEDEPHPERFKDEVIKRMKEKAHIAEKENVILLKENEHDVYYDATPERCREILDAVNSPNLKPLFDAGNFVFAGIKPYDVAYPMLKDDIVYLHIKDAIRKGDEVETTFPGKGDAQFPEILTDLKRRGFDGFLSLEPHLAVVGKMAGFSGPELFKKAIDSLKDILEKIE